MSGVARATWFVRGRVQGVGFRWWTRARALELGLVGHARNTDDGRVEVVAEGPPSSLDALDALLREEPSTARRPGAVTSVVRQEGAAKGDIAGFVEK
ncbi:acylphosphatase [Janibacter terrae]|jgi:acylphosphatase|uniref:acylphosphatase n=1 Tax=Janibacter terrae TaxID=103817 RepID=A0ABZ2FGN9_9MICO|nr:acylphosphatase [Janibacter terrae]MBA4083681.1 acylphosphatase [Kytococcus sp.]HBO54780.1 acylphosphatase [Janibacter terrae]HCE60322.1 acylphosphatase [Janibacter terrae]